VSFFERFFVFNVAGHHGADTAEVNLETMNKNILVFLIKNGNWLFDLLRFRVFENKIFFQKQSDP